MYIIEIVQAVLELLQSKAEAGNPHNCENFIHLLFEPRLHGQFFTDHHNATFRNYCVVIARKNINCNPATRFTGKIC